MTRQQKTPIQALIHANSIAIIGATNDANKLNGRPLHYLRRDGYQGSIYPVNPKYSDLNGVPCYPDIKSIPGIPDLAIVAVAARRVIPAIEAIGEKGIRVAIIFSSGFAEMGHEGSKLEKHLMEAATAAGIRICGPNNLGIINAFDGITASFSQYALEPPVIGPVAFASQSGAFGTGIASIARSRGIGFGYFVNTGNEADITLTEVLEELIDDERIQVSAAYIEGIKNPESFLQLAAKSIQLNKPLVVTKVGRKAAGARAAASHTGALAGEDEIFEAIVRQHGIVRARNEQEMLNLVSAFATCGIPSGRGVALITQSGGAAALMADRAEELGLKVPILSHNTQVRLREVIPAFGMPQNPVDLTAQFIAQPEILSKSTIITLEDPAVHCAVLWFQLMRGFVDEIIEELITLRNILSKPFIVCWIAAPPEAVTRLRKEGIHIFSATEDAIDIIAKLTFYGEARQRLLAAPRPLPSLLKSSHTQKPKLLSNLEARAVLTEAGLLAVEADLVSSAKDAVKAAKKLGLPVAVKVDSPDIIHKSDTGGVRLNLNSEAEVLIAAEEILANAHKYQPEAEIRGLLVQPMAPLGIELVLGMRLDPVFGPIIMLGLGGILVEILNDVSFAGAPLTVDDVSDMIQSLDGKDMLEGYRGMPPVNREQLNKMLIALAQLALNRPDIIEIDLNPVVASPEGLIAVDWSIFCK